MEIVENRFASLGSEEGDFYCVVHILSSKLAMRNFAYFERVSSIMTLTEKFPSNPSVLAHAGAYFNFIRDFETAEKMFVGALLVSPHHDGALLGFAHFFADAALRLKDWVRVTDAPNPVETECMWQANLSSAEKFLKKIDSKSPYSLMAKVEIIWRFYNGGEANFLSEKDKKDKDKSKGKASGGPELNPNLPSSSSTLLLSCKTLVSEFIGPGRKGQARTGSADRLASCLLHSLGFQYHCDVLRHYSISNSSIVCSSKEALECYERALTFDGENSQALVLMAMLKNSFCCHTSTSAPVFIDEKQVLLNQVDAHFRRGIMVTSSDVCMGLASLCYAEFLSHQLGDYSRAEQYYLDAERVLAGEESLWVCPVIAMALFYSNVVGDFDLAERLLTAALRDRQQSHTYRGSNRSIHTFSQVLSVEEDDDFEAPVAASSGSSGSGAYAVAALYVASAYFLLQRRRDDDDVSKENNQMAMEFMAMSLACEPSNLLSRQTLAILQIRGGSYRAALSTLQELVGHPNLNLNATVKLNSDSCPNPLSLLLLTVLLCNCTHDYSLAHTYITMACNCLEDNHRAHVGASVRYLQWHCARVRGQVLLFGLGDAREAARSFQSALRLLPWDALALACMALCRQRLKAVETELTASMKKLLRLRSGAKPKLLCHPPPLPFSQQQFVAHTANLTRSSSSSPERIKKSVAFSLERWDDMLHCSDPDLLMKAAADSGMRQRLSAQGQGHKADPVGPLTYLLAAQYEISRTNLPCGRTNAKDILFGYIQASATSEGGTATLHPLVLYMAGLCLDGFLDVRVTEDEDGNPVESEKMYMAAISNAALDPAACVERNLDRLKKTIFRLQKPNADHTTTSRDVQLVVPQERKNVLRRSKTSAGKKGPTTSLNNRTSSGIGNAAMVVPLVVVSSSAPVLGDLLKRFTNGDHHHRYHSQDDGDDDGGIQPHRGAEQSDYGYRQSLDDHRDDSELMQLTCMYQRHQRVLDQVVMQRIRLGKTLKNFRPDEDDRGFVPNVTIGRRCCIP
eukprot:gene33815-43697_t